MKRHLKLGVVVVVAAACGDNLKVGGDAPVTVDMRGDAPIDMPGDAGPCLSDRFVTGELVDLDSTTAAFMGVNNARFTMQNNGGITDVTSPNGRWELCAPPAASYLLDVDAIDDHLDGFAYIEDQAINPTPTKPIGLRSMTANRATTFYSSRGIVYDATKAHVLVYLAGDRSQLALDRAHGTTQAGNDDDNDGAYTWANGDSGRYVLFPNVDVTAATGTLTGDTSGPHTVPLAAGKLTLVALFWVFL